MNELELLCRENMKTIKDAIVNISNDYQAQINKLSERIEKLEERAKLDDETIGRVLSKLTPSKPSGLTFAEAIEAMKEGKRVHRISWKLQSFYMDKDFFVNANDDDSLSNMPDWDDLIATDWMICDDKR